MLKKEKGDKTIRQPLKLKKMLIKKLKLNNFKCFRETNIDFGKITLLTGANSSGKSSFIDALLAIMQTEEFPKHFSPNGKYKNLGGFKDISFQQNSKFIDINVQFIGANELQTKWQKAKKIALPELKKLGGTEKEFINNVDKKFNFIDSYREQPYDKYYQSVAKSKIETNGNGYTQQIFAWESYNKLKLESLINNLKKLKLVHSIKTEKRDDGTFKIIVKVHKNSIAVPLTSVGYGVSKILPLLVADLQLENHSLLAMSEPEIDLHPSVQADFAEYLVSQTKKNQKQYIVETHSEYIINRLRLLISKGEIKEDEIKVYFFENNGIETKTYSVQLKKNGQIVGAPDSFFETYETDVLSIALQ